ncbi:hypothetical protein CDD82_864 [Ophiocordyceps australis]|uniref:Exonuclease domain-containing protein n=1 Tax=Ophiocordyceps australis TaxID=1399860 RepID=A0A2C5YLA3_9HYPO|nr:hypothetical protein CDD82_864 [Ophiocordyceps australis]
MQKNLTLNSDQAAACKFHSGKVAFKKWTCCNNPPFSKPCSSRTYHTTRHYSPGELEESWALFMTPPSYSPQSAAAVVIDCEMGVARSGESELIRVSLIDYFSREVLLDSLVWPSVKMAHYNTRFSGVHRAMLENARQHCKCLFGRDEARRAILKFIDPDTIVIAHAGHQDLASLRWIHTAIIDTLIVEESRRQQKGV